MAVRPHVKNVKDRGRLLTQDDVKSRARSPIARIPFDPYGFPVVSKGDGSHLRQVIQYIRKRGEVLFALAYPQARGYAHAYGIALDLAYNWTRAETKLSTLPKFTGVEPGEIDHNKKTVETDGRNYETWLKAFNLGRQDGMRLKQYHLKFRDSGVYPAIAASNVLEKGLSLEAADPESDLRAYPEMQFWPILASSVHGILPGKPFDFVHNTNSSQRYKTNQDFGQKKEPAGRYINLAEPSGALPPGWEYGRATFKNPLSIPWGSNGADYNHPDNWKQKLSVMFGGKTGKRLSQAIRDKGYDGIVTYDNYGPSEIVDLTMFVPRGLNTLTASLSQLAALDGTKFFSKKALEYADDATASRASRETLISLTPDEFLSMAEGLSVPDEGKTARVASAQGQFSDLPFLIFENFGNKTAKVVGHEGRHRMLFLKAQGVKHVPVLFKSVAGKGPAIRWGNQEANGFDKIDVWPETLIAERGSKTLPFPMSLIYPRNEITASLEIVYHATSSYNLASMLSQNRIKLSTTLGTPSDRSTNERPFFMSLTRTRVGGYHTRATGHGTCLIELDYDYLRSRYKIQPRDYWGPEFRKADQNINEMEETLTTDKAFIPLPRNPTELIRRVDILLTEKEDDRGSNAQMRALLISLKKAGIPYRVYNDKKAWMAGSPKQLGIGELLPLLKGQEHTGYSRVPRNWFKEYLELMNAPSIANLSKKAQRMVSDLRYYPADMVRRLRNDLHNERKSDTAIPIVKSIAKAGGIEAFLNGLRDRFDGQELTAAERYPYGYWITHDGVRIAVSHEDHARTARAEMRNHYPEADKAIQSQHPGDERPAVYEYADYAIFQLGWIRLVNETEDPKNHMLEVELSYGNLAPKAFDSLVDYVNDMPFSVYYLIAKGKTIIESAPVKSGLIETPKTLLHAVRKCVKRELVTASAETGAWITHEGVTIAVPDEKHAEVARKWVIANKLQGQVVQGFGTDDYNAYDYVVQNLGWVRIAVDGSKCEVNFYHGRLSLQAYQVVSRYLRASAFTDILVIAASRMPQNFAYATFTKPQDALNMLYKNIRSNNLTAMVEASEEKADPDTMTFKKSGTEKGRDFHGPYTLDQFDVTFGAEKVQLSVKRYPKTFDAKVNIFGNSANKFGPKNVRTMLAFLKKTYKNLYVVYGDRISGARLKSGKLVNSARVVIRKDPTPVANLTAEELTAASRKKRYFVRFGEIPKAGRSKLWTAPNAFHIANVGRDLPGISVYEAEKNGKQWEISTETLNMGSGLASLSELLYRAAQDKAYPIFLLTGIPVRWKDLSPEDRKTFQDYDPGKRAEHYDLEGTDGEPMLRDFVLVQSLTAFDLTNRVLNFPKDYDLEGSDMPKTPSERVAQILEAADAQSYTNKSKQVKLIFYKNRSTAQTCKPGQTVHAKAGYGKRTTVRNATPEEVAQLKKGVWLRTRESGLKATDKGAKQTKYRPWLTASARVEKHLADLGLK